MTQVRKRQALTRMKYDRVDLVGEGANEHAHILLAKSRKNQPETFTVRKAMGQIKCNKCGMMNAKGAEKCKRCGSSDLAKTKVTVIKTVTNPKKTPKNDDATNSTSNATAFTFEDEQYDQDNGENGQALGDSIERSSMSKSNDGWFDITKDSPGSGESVDTVDNEEDEEQKEGEDSDKDIERLAETKPTGLKPDKRQGYQNTATSSSDSTMSTHKSRAPLGKKKRLRKEKPGLNSYDLTDGGSQVVAENAEQLYRSEADPTVPAQTRLESTMSDANRSLRLGKARRKKSNSEGLDIMDHGLADGIYSKRGIKRNGTGTGHTKYTTKPRTSVAPPRNPLDKSKGVQKSSAQQKSLVAVEAANLAVRLAKNLVAIHEKDRPDLYPAVVSDFLDVLNAGAQEWFAGSSITKSSTLGKQVENVAGEVYELLRKASPASEMSDEASAGADPDSMDDVATNSMGKLQTTTRTNKNEKEQTVVGKKKLYKSVARSGDNTIEVELDPVTKGRLDMLDELLEEREAEKYISKARDLQNLPGFQLEKVAKQLRAAYERSSQEGEELEQMLKSSANIVSESAVLKQYGMTGSGSMGGDDMRDKMDRAYAHAKSVIGKSADGMTEEMLAVQYMKDHPEEYYQPAKQLRG